LLKLVATCFVECHRPSIWLLSAEWAQAEEEWTGHFAPTHSTGNGPSRLTPIVINDNFIDFMITPTLKRQQAKVDWRPRSSALQVHAQVETIAAGGESKIECRPTATDRFVLQGKSSDNFNTPVWLCGRAVTHRLSARLG
jgi:hypothetical protein